MDKRITGPYWRFWVYGAVYHSVRLNDSEEGMRLLDEGLRHVRRDGLMNVFGSYRRVLVDSIPWREIHEKGTDGKDPVQEYQREALEKLASVYETGIRLGVENGHVLAIELAKLYQERAAMAHDDNIDFLDKALEHLNLAETLYTGNPNHPATQIYEAKIRVLMAQGEYGQALILLRSLPQRTDPSLETMYRLALQRSGEKLEEVPAREGQTSRGAGSSMGELSEILASEEHLYQLAQEVPSVAETIFRVAYRIQQEMEQRHD